ncbi:MAG: hypothetical protein V3U84_06800 [Thiotrichaceae bacterium]
MNILKTKININETPLTSAKARKWVELLPTSNFGEMTRRLYFCMTELNNSQIHPQKRIEIAEIIRPYSEMSLENLKKHLVARSFPLPERSQKIFDLNQSLLLEMSGAYQLSALDMLTKGSANKKLLLLSIGRSLNYMGRVLINTYTVYIKPKEALWQDIHHLYLLACENNIEHLTIPEKTKVEYSSQTIEDYYKHINLLALARPSTIRLGEISRLDRFFRLILNDIEIHTDPTRPTGKYAYTALLNSDEPPTLMPVAELLNSPTVRLFAMDKTLKALDGFARETENTNLGSNDTFPMLNHSLAIRLINSLTFVKNRQFKRFPRDEQTPLISHLSNIVKVIKIEQENSDDNLDYAEDEHYEELIYGENSSSSSPWAATDAQQQLEETDIELRAWQIQNSCSEGYGLRWKEKDPSGVRVGELIAMQDPADDSEKWQIGTIRWMDFIQSTGLLVGIELLSPRALPVTIKRVTNRTLTQKLPISGLLLPKIEGLKEKPYLVLPDYMFNLGDILEMKIGKRMENVEIIHINEGQGAFALCEYIASVSPEELHQQDDTYNEIWEVL